MMIRHRRTRATPTKKKALRKVAKKAKKKSKGPRGTGNPGPGKR
jgi:hypothetical protein